MTAFAAYKALDDLWPLPTFPAYFPAQISCTLPCFTSLNTPATCHFLTFDALSSLHFFFCFEGTMFSPLSKHLSQPIVTVSLLA